MTNRPRTVPFPPNGGEPPLEELLSDPVLHAVMASDGVIMEDLDGLVLAYRSRKGIATARAA